MFFYSFFGSNFERSEPNVQYGKTGLNASGYVGLSEERRPNMTLTPNR